MALNLAQFHIVEATPRGVELLEQSEVLQNALRLFHAADEAFKARVPGSRLLNAGRYGFTFCIDGVAVKVTSPTSSQESFLKKTPLPPENLQAQYEVLSALRKHLQGGATGITTPEQFFVVHSPADVYILVQEYMAGWVQVEERTHEYYENVDESDQERARQQIKVWTRSVRDRLSKALADFPLAHMLDDLALERESGVHGGNLMVPADAMFADATPLCIIDQPGHELRKSKRAKESS